MTVKRNQSYPLRMAEELRVQAEKRAKEERRSLNAWLQVAIEEKLERYKEKGAA